MSNSLIILKQLFMMSLYMAIGFGMYKKSLITKEGCRSMANLLLYVIVPCVLIKSFYIEKTPEKTAALLWAFTGGVIVLGTAIFVAAIVFKKNPIDNFGATYSNAGFMGIPLVTAVVGTDAVFYVASTVALINVLQWTHGQAVLTGDKSNYSIKAVIRSPLVMAVLIGLLVFLAEIKIPLLLSNCIGTISALNAPIGMIVLGVYMGEVRFLEIFNDWNAYKVSAIRLLIIPALTLGGLFFIPVVHMDIRITLLIAACAPIGSNVAVYAQKLNKDYNYAVKTVCLSTILSVFTIPLFMMLAMLIWN